MNLSLWRFGSYVMATIGLSATVAVQYSFNGGILCFMATTWVWATVRTLIDDSKEIEK